MIGIRAEMGKGAVGRHAEMDNDKWNVAKSEQRQREPERDSNRERQGIHSICICWPVSCTLLYSDIQGENGSGRETEGAREREREKERE